MVKGRIHSLESFGTVDGPGIRFITFLQGCPLRCLYCHNPDTWKANGDCQYTMTAGELFAEVKRYKNFIKDGGVTMSGGEPLLQADFVKDFLKLCKADGIHTALDTSGYIVNTKAMEVLEYTDLVLLDIKTMNLNLHQHLTGVKGENTFRFLDELQRLNIPTWIRHVIVPGLTDSPEWIEALGKYLKDYTVVEKIELLPYHSLAEQKYEALGMEYALKDTPELNKEQLDKARKILDNAMVN